MMDARSLALRHLQHARSCSSCPSPRWRRRFCRRSEADRAPGLLARDRCPRASRFRCSRPAARARPPLSVTSSACCPHRSAAVQTVAQALPTVGPIILWIWACGAIAGLAWLLAGAWRLRQMRRRSTPASLRADVDAVRIVAGAPRASSAGPTTCSNRSRLESGARSSCCRERFSELTHDAKRAVACHELLHVKRRDWMWIVLEEHVRALFWFHPARLVAASISVQLAARTGHRPARRLERDLEARDYMLALMMFADRRNVAGALDRVPASTASEVPVPPTLEGDSHVPQRLAWTTTALALC